MKPSQENKQELEEHEEHATNPSERSWVGGPWSNDMGRGRRAISAPELCVSWTGDGRRAETSEPHSRHHLSAELLAEQPVSRPHARGSITLVWLRVIKLHMIIYMLRMNAPIRRACQQTTPCQADLCFLYHLPSPIRCWPTSHCKPSQDRIDPL